MLLLNHEGEFQRASANPSNTRPELPPVDVNRVLAEHYRTSEPLTFIRKPFERSANRSACLSQFRLDATSKRQPRSSTIAGGGWQAC